jgi:Ca-activated chloride channel family protein
MAEEFILDWKVDQPAVLTGRREEVFTLVTVRPNLSKLGPLLEGVQTALPAHLIVVVDVSGSMQLLIRDDPYAKILGSTTSEGNAVQMVQTNVPSRLEVAIHTVEQLTKRMGPDDRMTLIGFDHEAHPMITAAPAGAELSNAIQRLADTGGGGTSMGRGLASAVPALRNSNAGNATRKIVVLTDGEDQDVDLALQQARLIGSEHHVPIHAFGTGESNGPFLTDICKTTLGGGFNNIADEKDAARLFDEVLQGQKNTLATNVKLTLWLSPEILVQELYRTRPEILYVGKLRPNAENQIEVNLEYMERGKVYEFLFRCEVPARDAGRFRLGKATLAYDIPALSLAGQKADANIVVEYTTDVERAQVRVGDVRRTIAQAEVQRQVLFMQEKRDLIESGRATEQDKAVVARLLDNLIQKFEEFGDQMNRNAYAKVRDEYRSKGTISQQTLNQSLASSSKVAEQVAVQEVDF